MDDYSGGYDWDDVQKWRTLLHNEELKKSGKCNRCNSKNIKTSKLGNLYCGDLCWTKKETPVQKVIRKIKQAAMSKIRN